MSKEGKKKAPSKKKAKKSSADSSPRSRKETSSPIPLDFSDTLPTIQPTVPRLQLLCQTHSRPFIAYSAGKETLVCETCTRGHESLFYPIIAIEEAFRRKIGEVYGILNSRVYDKKQLIEGKIEQLEERLDEVKKVKTAIERDMRSEFAAMNERLVATVGSKESEHEHILRDIHSDLERISSIVREMEAVSNDSVSFLLKHKDLRDMCEMALAKPLAQDVASLTHPKELSEVRETVEALPAIRSLLEFKDEVIYKLSRPDRPRTSASTEEEEELREWVKLADRYSTEVTLLRLECSKCHCALSEDTVNARCPSSRDFHYFIKAKGDLPEARFPEYIPPAPEVVQPLTPIQRVRALAAEHRIDVEKVLKGSDALNTGVLPPSEFQRVLVAGVGVPSEVAAELARRYDTAQSGRVQYPLFVADLQAPVYALFDRLRGKAQALVEQFTSLDIKRSGCLPLDRFRESLRRAGFSQQDIALSVELTELTDSGEVPLREFLQRVKLGK